MTSPAHNRSGRQRGSILVYTMLTMSAMLAIGTTLNGIFVSKLRSAGAARNATIALYAADSGTESCLYAARTGTAGLTMTLANESTVTVKNLLVAGAPVVDDCATLGAGPLSFQVIGGYRNATRALEISQ